MRTLFNLLAVIFLILLIGTLNALDLDIISPLQCLKQSVLCFGLFLLFVRLGKNKIRGKGGWIMDYLKWIGRKISKNNVKFTIAIAFIAVHLGGYLIAINGGNRILALGLVLGSYLLGTAFAVGHTYYIADKKKTERVQ